MKYSNNLNIFNNSNIEFNNINIRKCLVSTDKLINEAFLLLLLFFYNILGENGASSPR